MKKLNDIIRDLSIVSITGNADIPVLSLHLDSRTVSEGGLFIALGGTKTDGHDYISKALSNGASAIICERLPEQLSPGITYVLVEDSQESAGLAASSFYGNPSRCLRLVGITGTNGKTTTATLLHDLFTSLGYQAGLISTVENRIGVKKYPSTHTTPDPIAINSLMGKMVSAGCEYCFMEVSSHGIDQKRIAGLRFAGGVFTNITHDHLDYHGDFSSYIAAKKRFFDDLPTGSFALTNADDRNGNVMVQNTKAKVSAYSLRTQAGFRCKIKETLLDGMLLEIDGRELWVSFTGRFNAYNLLAVYAAAVMLGAEKDEVLVGMSKLTPVSGRFESLRSETGITAIVDYAHTPDALRNVLETIGEIRTSPQKIITVIGCGGDRDAAKRPLMATIASEWSELTILTSDNPRSENPATIIDQMKPGLLPGKPSLCISDRSEAIKTAVYTAHPGDIILVAGKGHEKYQEISGIRNHFDDREELVNAFNELNKYTG